MPSLCFELEGGDCERQQVKLEERRLGHNWATDTWKSDNLVPEGRELRQELLG